MKVIFKTNLFIWFSHFQTQLLKSYSRFIFLMTDSNLVQTIYNKEPEGVLIWQLKSFIFAVFFLTSMLISFPYVYA
jgi:hypothetical protein